MKKENDPDIVDYIRLNDYIEGLDSKSGKNSVNQLSTDAYYCTGGDVEKVLGKLTLTQNMLFFEPNLKTNANHKK